jgi:hypothetical protein
MIEIKAELWNLVVPQSAVICITTNGTIKKNGECVMGRGCAFEAKNRYPGSAKRLGTHILAYGNTPCWINSGLVSFPVKHNWWEEADIELIKQSALWLCAQALNLGQKTFYLPRPGCGNGRLKWENVEPHLRFLPDNVKVVSR